MTIQPISTNMLDIIGQVAPVQGTTPGTSGAVTAGPDESGGSSATLSNRAQFLAKLQDLEQTDPARAKQVLTDMAGQLKTEAQQETGAGADRLNDLANKLQTAADTGDLSGLAPAKGAHHHGGHHHPKTQQAQQAYGQASDPGKSLLDMLNSELSTVTPTAPDPSTAL